MDKYPPANAGDTGSIPAREDPTLRRATKAPVPQLLKPVGLELVLGNKRSHCNEKPVYHKEE